MGFEMVGSASARVALAEGIVPCALEFRPSLQAATFIFARETRAHLSCGRQGDVVIVSACDDGGSMFEVIVCGWCFSLSRRGSKADGGQVLSAVGVG